MSYRIPINNVSVGEEELRNLKDVIQSGWLSEGKYTREFERRLSGYIGTKHAVALSAGTAALHLALLSKGIGKGDEVIVPAFTFIATANAVGFTGATPVFAEIDPGTLNISPESIEAKITGRTKALIVVHFFGRPCEMDRITKICAERGIILVEDACQAFGSEFGERKVGSFGIGCFSMYGNKTISAGEGGALTTDEDTVDRACRTLKMHGRETQTVFEHKKIGFNYKFTELQAAVASAQVSKAEQFAKARIEIGEQYTKRLAENFDVVRQDPRLKIVYWRYPLLTRGEKERDTVIESLKKDGIEVQKAYLPIHQQPCYSTGDSLPETERVYGRTVALPCFPGLTGDNIGEICGKVEKLLL